MRRRHSLRLSGTRKKSIASCAKHGSSWNVHEWIMIMNDLCHQSSCHGIMVSWCIMMYHVQKCGAQVCSCKSCKLTQLQPCPLEGKAVWMHPKYLHSPGAEQQVCPVTFWKKRSKTVRSSRAPLQYLNCSLKNPSTYSELASRRLRPWSNWSLMISNAVLNLLCDDTWINVKREVVVGCSIMFQIYKPTVPRRAFAHL